MTTSQRTPARPRRLSDRAASVGVLAVSALALPVLAAAPTSASPVVAGATSSDGVVALLGADERESPTARVRGRDGRLGAGCRDYPVRYAVDGAEDDWLLELVVSDRSGDQVASVSLHGVESAARGRTSVTLCRASVRAGRFAVRGLLTERDGYQQVEHAVEGDRFRLTRR